MVEFALRLFLMETLGRFMQLFSVENLSLAAEATAVLLLLAFAWPERKVAAVCDRAEEGESTNWEPAKKFYLQACLFRGLYLQRCSDSSDAARPFTKNEDHKDDSIPLIPVPWQDRLTKCLNRAGLDSVLNQWLSVDLQHRRLSNLSMVRLPEYSEMVSLHGAMVMEQALQSIANKLIADLGDSSIIARYLPDRFMVLHLASSLRSCQETMATVQKCFSNPSFFSVGGQPTSIASIVCIVGLADDTDLTNRIDELEEGGDEAEQSGRNTIAKVDGLWTVAFDGPSSTHFSAQAKTNSESVTSDANHPSTSNTAGTETKDPETDDAVPTNTVADALDVTETAPGDILAVAGADDIAALFAQINAKKSAQAAELQSNPAVATSDQPPATSVDLNESASADDIAALFAASKPAVKPVLAESKPVAAEQPTPVVSPAPSIDLNESASADDIAALFAASKPAAKPVPAEPNPVAAEQPAPVVAPAAPIDLNESASADDIAALFASSKPAAKPVPAEPNPVAAEPPATVVAPAAPIDLNESASADDIAALFAASKPAAKPFPAEPKPADAAPPKPADLPAISEQIIAPKFAEDANAVTTEDDIAALFATVKSAIQPDPADPAALNPDDGGANPQAPSVPIPSEQLAEIASADDIAMLFQSVKQAGIP